MRRASVEISIQGKDVSMDLWPHLLSLSYVDKADDELDDLQLTLEDREGLWQGDWLPKHGDIISVTIVANDFRAPGEEELDCGEFEVDELTLETSRDGGDVVTIKGVPAAVKSSLMLQKKTRAWADVPLSTVATWWGLRASTCSTKPRRSSTGAWSSGRKPTWPSSSASARSRACAWP